MRVGQPCQAGVSTASELGSALGVSTANDFSQVLGRCAIENVFGQNSASETAICPCSGQEMHSTAGIEAAQIPERDWEQKALGTLALHGGMHPPMERVGISAGPSGDRSVDRILVRVEAAVWKVASPEPSSQWVAAEGAMEEAPSGRSC